jgi:hypothetical protein
MTSKPPPVPPASRSRKSPGNIKQNTTNQGYQQDS